MTSVFFPPPQYREIKAADMPGLFQVRMHTRENSYTLEQLHRLGITPESVVQKLATTFKGWLCTVWKIEDGLRWMELSPAATLPNDAHNHVTVRSVA